MKTMVLFLILAGLGLTGAWAVGSSSGGSGSGSSGGSGSSTKSVKGPTADEWYDQGYTAAMAQAYQAGADALRKAIALRANFPEAYNMLGFCLRNLGQIEQAFAAYEKALALKPVFPEAREYYGEAWLKRGNVAKAEEQYKILAAAGNEEAVELREAIDEYLAQH